MLKGINFYLMWLWSQFPEITSTFSDQQFWVTACAVWQRQQAHCNPALSSPVLSFSQPCAKLQRETQALPPPTAGQHQCWPITANKPPQAQPSACSCYSFIFKVFSSHQRKIAVHVSSLDRDKRLLFCATKTSFSGLCLRTTENAGKSVQMLHSLSYKITEPEDDSTWTRPCRWGVLGTTEGCSQNQ